MKLQIKGRVTDIYESAKGRFYITMLDTEQGGMAKFIVPAIGQIKIDSLVDLDALVKPGIFNNNLNLEVIQIFKKGGD